MDFGFGAFLEKFEQRFGDRPTSILLGLMGLAVAITCIGLIWTFVRPGIDVNRPLVPSFFTFDPVSGVAPFMVFCLGVAGSSYVLDSYRLRLLRQQMEDTLSLNEELLQENRRLADEIVSGSAEVREIIAAADMMMDDMIAAAQEHKLLPEGDIQGVRKLLRRLGSDEHAAQ